MRPRIALLFVLFVLQLERAVSQEVFSYFEQDSVHQHLDRQLSGLLAALSDSSATVKAQALDRLTETHWEGNLPDTALIKIAAQIDTTEKGLNISICSALGAQEDLDNSYLLKIVELFKDEDGRCSSLCRFCLG